LARSTRGECQKKKSVDGIPRIQNATSSTVPKQLQEGASLHASQAYKSNVQTLANACVELSALCVRFSAKAQNGHHSLAPLLGELDAFKAKWRHHDQRDFAGFAKQSPVQEPSTIGYLDPIKQNVAVRDSEMIADGAPFQGFFDTNTTTFQNGPDAVGMDGDTFQLSNDTQTTAGEFYSGFATPASSGQDINANISGYNFGNLDATWNDQSDFDWAVDLESLGEFEMPSPEQLASGQQNSTATSPVAASEPALIVGQNTSRFSCLTCHKIFTRQADRDRHSRVHNQNATRFHCPALNCHGRFLRKDKLADHQRRMGH
jgi:hypothetical protein